ncbi:MAG: diaminopimelate decarboxylase [Methanomicrobia archaeon]|nr:diaminopimelate decarboxylase [Methanomicrobia archaeon]
MPEVGGEGGNGRLVFGGADVVELAEQYGTPLYIIDEHVLRNNFRRYKDAFASVDNDIYFAVKANGNLAVLRILAQEGAGADVFSGGELELVKLAGIPLNKVLFNGNAKSEEELRAAVESRVTVSVDSREELQTLSAVAGESGTEAMISMRVNPDVSPNVNPKIATGLRTAKFGIPYEKIVPTYEEAVKLPNIVIKGIHCHIGSQILDISVFEEATEKMMRLVEELYKKGIELEFVDLGGGLGISYEKAKEKASTPQDLAAMILPTFTAKTEALGITPRLILEPGRSIVGPASILVCQVNTVKDAYKHFVAIDAGFNLFVRPAMYDAYHEVVVTNKVNAHASVLSTVVGPICESGDIVAKDRMLPDVKRGDYVAIQDTGAYGFSMSSQYNGRPRCAEVLVKDGTAELIREKESIVDIIRHQVVPERLR